MLPLPKAGGWFAAVPETACAWLRQAAETAQQPATTGETPDGAPRLEICLRIVNF